MSLVARKRAVGKVALRTSVFCRLDGAPETAKSWQACYNTRRATTNTDALSRFRKAAVCSTRRGSHFAGSTELVHRGVCAAFETQAFVESPVDAARFSRQANVAGWRAATSVAARVLTKPAFGGMLYLLAFRFTLGKSEREVGTQVGKLRLSFQRFWPFPISDKLQTTPSCRTAETLSGSGTTQPCSPPRPGMSQQPPATAATVTEAAEACISGEAAENTLKHNPKRQAWTFSSSGWLFVYHFGELLPD